MSYELNYGSSRIMFPIVKFFLVDVSVVFFNFFCKQRACVRLNKKQMPGPLVVRVEALNSILGFRRDPPRLTAGRRAGANEVTASNSRHQRNRRVLPDGHAAVGDGGGLFRGLS